MVMRRLVEQTTDTRLNPELRRACKHDMAKFCSALFDRANTSSTELNGLLTECLKVGGWVRVPRGWSARNVKWYNKLSVFMYL